MNWNDADGRTRHKPKVSGPATCAQVMSSRQVEAAGVAVPPARSSVTITDPLRLHFQRASSSSSGPPNLIVNWVNRLEKLNASLDETGAPASTSEAQHRHSTAATSTRSDKTTGHKHQSIVTIAGDSERQQQQEEEEEDETKSDFCFKAAQLATEFLLMLFAASLLVIATIVIFSKRIPDFMQSYEIVPKFLFFTCLIVAGYSFLSWSVRKINAKRRGNGGEKDNGSHPEVTTETLGPTKQSASKDATQAEASRRLSLITSMSKEGAYKRSSLQEPLLAHYSPTTECHHHHDHHQQHRRALTQTTSPSRPPTRQVAFDASPHLLGSGGGAELPSHKLTIDEESDQEKAEEMSCASA